MRKALLLILPLLLTIFVFPSSCVDYGEPELWALIVGGQKENNPKEGAEK